MRQSAKVTIHMVASLDGFIAKGDGTTSWMQSNDTYNKGKVLSEEDIANFLSGVECYVMGSKTYEHALALGWPYGEVPVIVVTNRKLKANKKYVEFFSGDLEKLINQELKPKYKNIWMVGGAMLTKEFMRQQLADEIVIAIMPIILGEGTLFFDYIGKEQPLHLKDVTPYNDGMVELSYDVIKG